MAELVGLGVQPPDMLGKLSQLLQIKGAQQSLRAQTAQAQMTEQDARQRAALASYDWNKHIGEDGTLDLESLNDPELKAAAGDKYLEVLGHAVQAKTAQLQSKQTLVSLRNDQRAAFAEMMGALRSDKDVAEDNEKGRQKVTQAMIQYGEMYGDDVLPVLSAYAGPLQKAPKGRMSDALRAIQLQANSAGQQLAAQQPMYTGRGGSLLQTNPNAAAGYGEIPLTLPPGAQIVTDAAGRQYQLNPQTNTVQPIGTGTAPSAPPGEPAGAPGFQQPSYPGWAHDVETFRTQADQVRAAGDMAPQARNINARILQLSKDAKTGPGTEIWQHAIGAAGAAFGLSPNANYQELGKFLEKNAIAAMQTMGGPPSDSRLEAAAKANGSTSFNREALQAVTKFNDATNTALEQYRQGMDKAVGLGGAVDYTKLPQFRAGWAKNFDVDVFRVENAIRDGDKEELESIKKELGPERLKALAQKRKNLTALSQTGALP